ncbi:asparaginase [Serpentinimonas barnesii]|uniref:asparaginase n=1 Tax=Serpentinimonas barnesii TaxID=1458427 RepID=UPI0005EF9B82|nr:asparaginase [Serpentinimonas barnesii]
MAAQQPLIAVIGTGGTIAGCAPRPGDTLNYQAAVLPVQDLLAALEPPPGFAIEAQQLAQIDSKDVSEAHWRALLQAVQQQLERPQVQGVLVTHGTDTLEESAFLLQTVLQPAKPVLLVGAMRPSTALLSDGAQNLADALWLAAVPGACGVLVPCAGRVYAGHEVRKLHPHRLDAFGAGDAGALAALEGGRLQRWRPWPGEHRPPREGGDPCAPASPCRPALQPSTLLQRLLAAAPWPRVEWISSHGAQSGAVVRALLLQHAQAGGAEAPLRGLLVAGTGNATVHSALAQALRQAEQAGVVVWRCSRIGSCVPSGPDAAQFLLDGVGAALGVPAGGAVAAAPAAEQPAPLLADFPVTTLAPAQARLALQLHLL